MTDTGQMAAYLDPVYDEAVGLMADIRTCVADVDRSDGALALLISRVITDVGHVVAWILVHKAVRVGEITPAEALMHPAHQLPELRGDLGDLEPDVATLPISVRNLAARARTLRQRAGRLDTNLLKT